MKSSLTYALVSLLGVSKVAAGCIEGHREVISPTYTVEYKCGVYKQGTTHNGISSVNECASLCESAGIGVCSYHAPSKRCIVSTLDGKDIPRDGVYYLAKVDDDEDPFKEDPFAGGPVAERDACLVREAALKADLASCHADAAAAKAEAAKSEAAKPAPLCGVPGIAKDGRIDLVKLQGIAACKAKCLSNPKCQAYSGGEEASAWCYIFSQPHRGNMLPGYLTMRSYDRDC